MPPLSVHRSTLSLFVLSQLACAGAPPSPALPFLGRWRASSFRSDVPRQCHDMVLEFLASGAMVSRSGDQVLTAHFVTRVSDSGFILTISNMQSNGRPNCQGLSADFVLSHQVPQMYTEVSGDTLRYGDGPDMLVGTMIKVP